MNARRLALRVIEQVQKEGAYLAKVLAGELSRSGLDLRDRALATELAYGVIRTLGHLEARLEPLLDLGKTDERVLRELELAVYQIDFLPRIPPRAAVSEAVARIRRVQGPRVAGFVNAVLRRILENPSDVSLGEASYRSLPEWLRARLEDAIGLAEARNLVDPGRGRGLTLRIPKGERLPSSLAGEAEAIAVCEGAFHFTGRGDVRARSEFAAGAFTVQELGSQLIPHLLGVRPGAHVLDVCAGRGNKSLLLAELTGPGGRVVATDLHPQKLTVLQSEAARLSGARANVETRAWDATTEPPPDLRGAFDFVLVDAPCSGTGTLRRRPEIALRLAPDDPARLGRLQGAIARNAALALRPGGQLLFSTCSVLPEEGELAIAELGDVLLPSRDRGGKWAEVCGPGASARLLPLLHGSDGYFLARLERA